MCDQTDSSLMEAVRQGDLNSLAVLFERHHRALFHFFVHVNGNRDLSRDLVQDVFLRILKYRQSWQPDRSYTAWMYQIARNAQNDALSKRKVETELVDKVDTDSASVDAMDDKLNRKQEIATLRRAMARLPLEKRELLVLSRFENLKYEQIASILGVDVGTVKVRVYRAVRQLGQIFFELSGEKVSI